MYMAKLLPILLLSFSSLSSFVKAEEWSKVQPIFENKCYSCHSLTKGKNKGGLTLDNKDGLMKGGETGKAFILGEPDKSLIIKAIEYNDKDLQMPPKNERLTKIEIDTIKSWIKNGADIPAKLNKLTGLNETAKQHWAYQPIHYTIPNPKNSGWCKTPIDKFILSKLESENMLPSPDVKPEALIRRVYYDLTGLPPSLKDIYEFQAKNNLRELVEKLLASHRYGEKWGRMWLDVARYSDTSGDINTRNDYYYTGAWTYRDWVIKSFNDDKTPQNFIKEQLCADLLKSDETALGFLTVGIKFNNNNDQINEKIDVIGRGLLGITLACARCHDHMFDPVSTKDYYALHGIFASTQTTQLKELVLGNSNNKIAFEAAYKSAEDEIKVQFFKTIHEYTAEFLANPKSYIEAACISRNNAEKLLQRQQIILDNKLKPELVEQVSKNIVPENNILGALLMIKRDVPWKNIKKRELSSLVPKFESDPTPEILIDGLVTSLTNNKENILSSLKEFKQGGVSIIFQYPQTVPDVEFIRKTSGDWNNQILNKAKFKFQELALLKLTHPGAPGSPNVVKEGTPQDSKVLIRGQGDVKGDLVKRGFINILGSINPENGSGRLQLAEAIVNSDITYRTMANRIWQGHFGKGLVETPDNLGVQSGTPVYKDLLDWLSEYLKKYGVKNLHRVILMSHVYQMGESNMYRDKDPDNKMFWCFTPRRLDFEGIRDTMLVLSGKIDFSSGKPFNLTEEPYVPRRSVYGFIDRANLPEIMTQFDFASPEAPNGKRTSTIVPQQALFFMNSPMVVDAAKTLVKSSEFVNAGNDLRKLMVLYAAVLQRAPTQLEIKESFDYLKSENKFVPSNVKTKVKLNKKGVVNEGNIVERTPLNSWELFAQILLMANEAVFVP